MHMTIDYRAPSRKRIRTVGTSLLLICLASGATAVRAAQPAAGPELKLVTERVIVFKDGYGLILKRGSAVTDDKGEVFTNEVPDAAVLGSFWATPVEGRLLGMVAGWTEVKESSEKPLPCTHVVHILKANVGKSCAVQLPDKVDLTGVIREVLVQETSSPVVEALTAVLHPRMSAARSSVPLSDLAKSETRTELLTDIAGTHFVLRTKEGDVLVPINDVRRLTMEDMRTVLPHKFIEATRRRDALLRWTPRPHAAKGPVTHPRH